MNVRQSRVVRLGVAALVTGGVLIGSLGGVASAAELDRWGGPTGRVSAPGSGILGSAIVVPLEAAEEEALTEAINEEYGALNSYQAAIEQFGSVYPFAQIARSEQQHVNALARLFTRYGLTVPENPGLAAVPTWETIADACQTGVDAEIVDAALYDTLRSEVDSANILRVFDNLQAASLDSHLPAFETCN